MFSIIIIQNGASRSSLGRSIESARSTGAHDIIVLAQDISGIEAGGLTLMTGASNLNDAIKRAKLNRLVLIDARLSPQPYDLQAAVGALSKDSTSDISYVPLMRGADILTLEEGSIDDLVSIIGRQEEFPLLILALNRDAIASELPLSGERSDEMLAQLIVKGVIAGLSVSATDRSIGLNSLMMQEGALKLAPAARARLLQSVLAECNIEELFPNHPWQLHSKESASTAYHALAALFVRFGDLDSAFDCLKLSDNFEDSPRSLALKGLIAQSRGETLGAVANMVASLQGYEIRKHENDSHFVRFAPGNIDGISDNLQAGLTALNQSDNERALLCFSQAVFNFDPFFKEAGLTNNQ